MTRIPLIRKTRKFTRKVIAVVSAGFICIIVIFGVLGITALVSSFKDGKKVVETLDRIREAQVLLYEQHHSWTYAVDSIHRPDLYRRYLYEYSKYSNKVQNLLFNIKLSCYEIMETEPEQIDFIIQMHRSISMEHVSQVEKLLDERAGADKISAAVKKMWERNEWMLSSIEKLVPKIKNYSYEMIEEIQGHYLALITAGMVLLVIFAVILSVLLFRKIYDTQRVLEDEVKKRTEDLEDAYRTIKISEEKYRRIVEDTSNLIFTLDREGTIVTINNSSKDLLKLSPGKLQGTSISDIVFGIDDGKNITAAILKEKINQLKGGESSAQYALEVKTKRMIEPLLLKIKLERIDTGNDFMIIGRGYPVRANTVTECIIEEGRHVEIPNSLGMADEVIYRFTQNLERFIPPAQVLEIRVALREIILNAIEHGNLNISFSEKSSALQEGTYFQLLSERREDPLYRNRKVSVRYALTEKYVKYIVADDGNGFNAEEMLARNPEGINDNYEQHGRGILMTKSVFDSVTYNEQGNRVRLVKYL